MTPIMIITKQLLRTEFGYTVWADEVVLTACSGLSVQELQRDLGASHASIVRTLRHIYDSERFWTHNLISDHIPDVAEIEEGGASDQARPDPDFEILKGSWPRVWSDTRHWILSLPDDDLARELTIRKRDGNVVALPRWKVFMHMVNHSTLHRGQITIMLRALGKRPPNTDILTYYLLDSTPGLEP